MNHPDGDEGSNRQGISGLSALRRRHYLETKYAEIADVVPSTLVSYFNACISAGMPESVAMAITSQYHEFALSNLSHILDAAFMRTLDEEL